MDKKLCAFLRRENMLSPGDRVICAVSGGADSMALLWGMYLLKEKLGITLEAAHFNHGLRGPESDRDADFVNAFCDRFDIPCYIGQGNVQRGEKGLEAAAREARYGFLRSLGGIVATAHTANDNAETVIINLLRGSGLKGLGGISPKEPRLIRPMLGITRQEVESFLDEYSIPYVTDSSNETDDFLRNRLRHHVMPLLQAENPRLPESLSAMAQSLRQDEACLEELLQDVDVTSVSCMRSLPDALRARAMERFLKKNGVKEPSRRHLELLEALIFSENPSARADFPGDVRIARCYDTLLRQSETKRMPDIFVQCPCVLTLRIPGLKVTVREATEIINTPSVFTVQPQGPMILGSRRQGDAMKLPGGTKSLKKLFVDRKIPAGCRLEVPVLRDAAGILGVYGIGADESRKASKLPAVQLCFEKTDHEGEEA